MKKTNNSTSKTSSQKSVPSTPLRRSGSSKIAGVEKTTLISLAGVAAAGAAGYFMWRNREKIMSTASKLGESMVQPITHFFGASSEEVQDLDSMSTPSNWTAGNRESGSFRELDSDSKAL